MREEEAVRMWRAPSAAARRRVIIAFAIREIGTAGARGRKRKTTSGDGGRRGGKIRWTRGARRRPAPDRRHLRPLGSPSAQDARSARRLQAERSARLDSFV